MSALLDAAIAWNNLQDTTYHLRLGRKRKLLPELCLTFCPEDFPHLAGFQYATDVDFGIRRSELSGDKLLGKLLSGELDDTLIEKAAEWKDKISGRLDGLIALEETLDSDFLICSFEPNKVPYGTRIQAEYVIQNRTTGTTFFIFLDQDSSRWFCRSVFQKNLTDYMVNQAHLTVLAKRKTVGGTIASDYVHPNLKTQISEV